CMPTGELSATLLPSPSEFIGQHQISSGRCWTVLLFFGPLLLEIDCIQSPTASASRVYSTPGFYDFLPVFPNRQILCLWIGSSWESQREKNTLPRLIPGRAKRHGMQANGGNKNANP